MIQAKAGVQAAAGDLGAAARDLNEAQTLDPFAEVLGCWAGILKQGFSCVFFLYISNNPQNQISCHKEAEPLSFGHLLQLSREAILVVEEDTRKVNYS